MDKDDFGAFEQLFKHKDPEEKGGFWENGDVWTLLLILFAFSGIGAPSGADYWRGKCDAYEKMLATEKDEA